MKIVKPYARMLTTDSKMPPFHEFRQVDGLRLLMHIEWCARISHRSEDASPSWERFLRNVVMEHGDWSVVEHASVSVDAVMDRGITHEWVRHRIAAYTQESTRFVNYEKKMPPAFIYPKPEVECDYCLKGTPLGGGFDNWHHMGDGKLVNCPYERFWLRAIHESELTYLELLKKGWRPQEARSVFPNALASRIVTTANLRSWRHFFLMRTSKEAHPQMRQITIPLLAEFKAKIPLLYDDIVPEARQIDNLRLGK